jgi:hypothetical protein
MEELYIGDEIEDEQIYMESEEDVNMNKLGPVITREEFHKVLKDLRDKKATGTDEIPAEVLKNLDTETTKKLFNIITDCYEKGKISKDFFTSKCIIISKKENVNDCSNYRKISILSHASKILLNVIKHRLKNKIKNQIGEDQFGFKNEKGTREVILVLHQILDRRIDVGPRSTYVSYKIVSYN